MSAVLYLYGFVPPDAPTPPEGVRGMDDRPVELVDAGAFRAAISELDAETYREGHLERRLQELAWVARQGARHETVVTWFADHASIVPARLFTVFSSDAALRAEAEGKAEAIGSRLRRFRDRREWDLKVSYELATLARHLGELSDEAAAVDAEIREAAPGRRYLLERKRDEVARRTASGVALRVAGELLDELRPFADEVAVLELPKAADDLPVVLNAALLVATARAEDLTGAAAAKTAELESRGLRASLTGPWAPYRFVGSGSDA